MKKYRLQPKNHEKPILTLEVDTENRDWYIDTDDMEGAVQALKNFSSDCAHVHAFFINGKDCTEDVRMISACRVCAGTVQIPGIPTLDSVLPAGAFTPPAGKNGTGKFDGLFLGRRHISGSPVPIQGLTQEIDGVVIQGTVVEYDLKDLRDNKKLCILKIADETNGMLCKRFFDKGDDALSLEEYLKPGMTVKLRGNVRIDKFSGDFALQISQMEQVQNIVCVDHEEHSVTPRVELHLHTKMSLDGLIDLERIIKTIARWKHPAVAITDHGVIQAFPKIQDLAKKYGVKVIYGMEGYMIEKIPDDIDADRQRYDHIIILARNMTGLRNLYRMVTLSHLKFYKKRPLIPKPVLKEFREGLIYGSACVMGEFFRAVLAGKSDEELVKTASFYDYLEVQPLCNNAFLINDDKYGDITSMEDLKRLNRKVIEIGEKSGRPVCATSDAHFLFQEEQIYRDILLAKWDKPGKEESHPPVYIRTTQEMMDEFNYLPKEKAKEIVIENTRKIAASCDVLEPLADESKSYNPKISGADEALIHMCYDRAYSIYGNPLPELVKERLESELRPITKHGFGVLYYIAHKLVKHSNDRGYLVGSRGSVGSSFVATMAGITEVNPLPPHYVCPHCHWSHFFTDGSVGGGFDLPDKKCPQCGADLHKDGHDIPFAVFLGFDGDKVPDIDLNFSSGDDQAVAHKYTEELFGRDNVFRAGTITGIQDKTAFGYVRKYAELRGLNCNDIFMEKLSSGITGVKSTTGQHPAGIMVCPRDMDIHEFTPLQYSANKKASGTITTHFDYHSISGRMLKLDILGHDDPRVIRMLQDLTGVDPLKIPFNDRRTQSLFSSPDELGITADQLGSIIGTRGNTVGSIGLPEYGTLFVRKMLEDTKPKNFSELVRISGFSHGTNVWVNNAQDLIKNGTVKLEEAISTRDDVMNYLIAHGVKPITSFKVMENVRKGKGLEKADKKGNMSNNKKELEEVHVPQWFIDSCEKISYLFPRAHAVAYVMMAFRIAWFKVYYPLAFYAAYFTIRAVGAFNAGVILRGLDSQKSELKRIAGMDSPTAVDKDTAVVIEVAAEMYLRGFSFLPVDLSHSDASQFQIVGQQLLPPFNCIPALGEQAALDIIQARNEAPFTSKEDLRKRGKVSQAVIDTMDSMGILRGLPDEEQLNLFAL
jgi:DNA polymerase-3 subunit alpha (Gram-positive type)